MSRLRGTLVLEVEIDDTEALRAAALLRAEEEGIEPQDWEDIRTGPGDDLRMLLDPGLVPGAGFSILDSSVELNEY